ncbi:MAG: polymer-forming cytoskeletal protein [Anaerolineaceae bacterium]|nr:polymer-forming cytoskeletal protein [Anaerolineaceae bacterium]
MFKRSTSQPSPQPTQIERVTSVLGAGINWTGKLSGKGGVRIEGIFEGQIAINGLVVVGETGKVTCEDVRANTVIVAGAVNGGITAEKLEIRSTGRVWGNVTVTAFSTEEGAFLRGQVTMEDHLELGVSNTEKAIDQSAIENVSDQETE